VFSHALGHAARGTPLHGHRVRQRREHAQLSPRHPRGCPNQYLEPHARPRKYSVVRRRPAGAPDAIHELKASCTSSVRPDELEA
jgi:hypothetical protein